MPTAIEALVRGFFDELCNDRRTGIDDELIVRGYVSQGRQAPSAEGLDGVRQRGEVYQEALDGQWGVHRRCSPQAIALSLGGSARTLTASS
jgi:hypothetical protein